MYTVSLETMGKVFRGQGATALEAINSIPLTYLEVKSKGTLTLSVGGKTSSGFMYYRPLKRCFANKLLRGGLARQLEWLLKDDKAQKELKDKPHKVTKGRSKALPNKVVK